MSSEFEEGREKCPYGPATGYTGLIVGKTTILRPCIHDYCISFMEMCSVTKHGTNVSGVDAKKYNNKKRGGILFTI